MSKCRSMYAGSSGAVYNVNGMHPGNGNNKWQGLVSTTNMRSSIIPYVRTRADSDNRNVVFCMNQLGGVGRKSTMFATTADGVKLPCQGSQLNSIDDWLKSGTTIGLNDWVNQRNINKLPNIPFMYDLTGPGYFYLYKDTPAEIVRNATRVGFKAELFSSSDVVLLSRNELKIMIRNTTININSENYTVISFFMNDNESLDEVVPSFQDDLFLLTNDSLSAEAYIFNKPPQVFATPGPPATISNYILIASFYIKVGTIDNFENKGITADKATEVLAQGDIYTTANYAPDLEYNSYIWGWFSSEGIFLHSLPVLVDKLRIYIYEGQLVLMGGLYHTTGSPPYSLINTFYSALGDSVIQVSLP